MNESLLKIRVASESELPEAAQKVIQFAGSSTIWAFFGEMGVGKTTFIKALGKALGVSVIINSPTFSIVNEYPSPGGPVFHFDFYRIEKEEDAINMGCEEYFNSGALCLVEWPEKILNLLPENHLAIHLELEGLVRLITVKHNG